MDYLAIGLADLGGFLIILNFDILRCFRKMTIFGGMKIFVNIFGGFHLGLCKEW